MGQTTGRATVGRARPPAGRASVGGVNIGGVPVDSPDGPGGPGGPGGTGPGRGGAGGRGNANRRTRSKKARRRNWIIAAIAVVIMMAGTSLVGGTYVFASIAPPDQIKLGGESTFIYYSDGTQMAKIGSENRTIVPLEKIAIQMQHAVVATEDRSFYTNDGVDFKGIVRAFWNNTKGGETQGASTITQQYARAVADLEGATYSRKIEEAAIAMKLNDKLTKDQILSNYLNTVPFGRGAYGVEAAAQAYFKKSAADLTVEESLLLAGLIKNPNGGRSKDGKITGSPFDPNVDPEQALARWTANRNAMIAIKPELNKHGGDKYEVKADMQMPTPVKVNSNDDAFKQQFGLDRPTGHVVHQVMDEFTRLQKTDKNLSKVEISKANGGGLKIWTTIDKSAQDIAEKYTNRANKESPLNAMKENQVGALVAVEPYTGRVLAYYGGQNGSGADLAGSYTDPILGDGQQSKFGYHPAGSTMKVYTLAGGLKNGYSLNSRWDATSPRTFPGRGKPVKNSSSEGNCSDGPKSCQLWQATEFSLNIPFYALTEKIGISQVVDVARSAGVRGLLNDNREFIDLNGGQLKDVSNKFGSEIGFGQYPITVLDHAAGMASLAARGNAAKAHFIKEVKKSEQRIYAEAIKTTAMAGFTPQMFDDLNWTLQKVANNNKANDKWGIPNNMVPYVAAKTGTWELQGKYDGENGHSWTVGYTSAKRDNDPKKNYNGIAVAAWVGNQAEELPLKDSKGNDLFGATGGGKLFGKFMAEYNKGRTVWGKPFTQEPPFTGSQEKGDGQQPSVDPNPGNQPGGPGNQPGGPGGPGGGNNTLPGGGNPGGNNGGNGGGNGRDDD
ncbi:transglycosylase domain-containing protein [Virgisporangium aliadipatigenens]|uniref:transglycosylase domain-containing protein n=1 Tax=Virgisporangium aliadipatigenens TaxID=741659 RepID=UPI001943834F|nr:transglycosylase domain-containing protein [Virgisporangium aliadipatigenens]